MLLLRMLRREKYERAGHLQLLKVVKSRGYPINRTGKKVTCAGGYYKVTNKLIFTLSTGD
jgi:hypothetical protein